jgi:secondary thiamine-phosphate synthase enzyme
MDIETADILVETDARIEIHTLTDEVRARVADSGAESGMVLVSTGHTSAAVTTNEAEDRLLQDILQKFVDLVPPEEWYFHDQQHVDTDTQRNAFGHILSTMVKTPVMLVYEDKTLQFGQYEDVLLFEFDGPRERTVDVTVMH